MKVSMNVCFVCHLNAGDTTTDNRSCTLCHKKPKRYVNYRGTVMNHLEPLQRGYLCIDCHISVKIGECNVLREKCYFCHINRTEQYSEVAFVHQQHVARKQIDCFFCHEFVQHGNIKMEKDIGRILQTDKKKHVPDITEPHIKKKS